jgi:hypothetical protein
MLAYEFLIGNPPLKDWNCANSPLCLLLAKVQRSLSFLQIHADVLPRLTRYKPTMSADVKDLVSKVMFPLTSVKLFAVRVIAAAESGALADMVWDWPGGGDGPRQI